MEIKQLPDVQAYNPHVKISLTRVGVENVKKLVEIGTGSKRPIVLVSTFDIFVNLPPDIKGANLSRNFEVMYDVLETFVKMPVYSVEDLCVEIAKHLLQRHGYAEVAEVYMRSEYMWKRRTPVTGIEFHEPVQIFASAVASKSGDDIRIKKTVGAEVTGVTTCPCAQELVKEEVKGVLRKRGWNLRDIEEILSVVPIATHNQRGRGRILIETDGDLSVPLAKIIRIIEESMSASTFELLKRPDEAFITIEAHQNPKFVEDCVREMALHVVEMLKELPDNALIKITQINEESLHQHEAVAERIAYLGELRNEIMTQRNCRGGLAGGASDS